VLKRYRIGVPAVVCVILLTACGPDAELRDEIVSTQITGSANDGDSATPPKQYPAPALEADDGDTHASSEAAQFNRVAGMVDAMATDPAAPTLTEDEAVATSFNKVISRLVVARDGRFTFDIELDISGVEIRHDATLAVTIRAAVLNNNGQTIPNAGITSMDLDISGGAAGAPPQVVINADAANPEAVDNNGNYRRTLSGPNQGVQLAAGTYQLELDLRLRANAPIRMEADGTKPRARVNSASATIRLR
jgi:hypothetical protein